MDKISSLKSNTPKRFFPSSMSLYATNPTLTCNPTLSLLTVSIIYSRVFFERTIQLSIEEVQSRIRQRSRLFYGEYDFALFFGATASASGFDEAFFAGTFLGPETFFVITFLDEAAFLVDFDAVALLFVSFAIWVSFSLVLLNYLVYDTL